MIIVIPMAGLSSRFTKAGFVLPKYMLYVGDQSLFKLSVNSFEKYLNNTRFLFIVRDIFDTKKFVQLECDRLGITDYRIAILAGETRGQAETVYLGTKEAGLSPDESILISNIDTIRDHFKMPLEVDSWDGFLEVFVGSGPNWSYAKTESSRSTRVIETAEKKAISNYCSNGIYYFKRVNDFWSAFEHEASTVSMGQAQAAEFYVAPLYNSMIMEGRDIHIQISALSSIHFCGVPSEYHVMQQSFYRISKDASA
jgi:hypothetical protein